jgi:transposase
VRAGRAFSPDQIETRWIHYYTGSPCCGAAMTDTDEPVKVLQQVEIIDCPLRIEEHVRRTQCCSACGKKHLAPWPEDLKKAGLVGSRLTTWVGYLKSACHMSFLSIRKYLRDVVGLTLSRGHLRNLVSKVSDSLLEPYEQLIAWLPKEEMLNVDETGHRENGARLWTWCFRASLYTVFKISPSRGSDVLIDVLGQEFRGVLGCDYFSADRKYMRLNENVVLQFCLAHFIRDVKFLTKHPNAKNRRHGERLLGHFRKLFQTLHRRDGFASEATFRASLERIRDDLIHDAIMLSPGTREADNLGDRFVNHFESFFTFITTPGIPPTNNWAEQAIRFVAIHRRLTQGTRSPAGRITCQRLWTVIETCEQQARSTFNYLADAVSAYFRGQPAPSLVPDTS